MSLTNDEFDRLERMLYRPVSTRPDWLKAWRNEAQYLLYLARRAVDADDEELVQEVRGDVFLHHAHVHGHTQAPPQGRGDRGHGSRIRDEPS
jgi:hypothetical protein